MDYINATRNGDVIQPQLRNVVNGYETEKSTLSRHIERHHKDQLKNVVSVVCAKNETAK